MDRFKELIKQVGRPYEMFNEDGTYQGCFYPVQFLYPDKPKYKLRSKDDDKNYMYGMAKLKKHCVQINKDDLKQGDIIATRYRDELHVAVFYEYDKIIHVFKDHTLQIGRYKMFKNFECYRVKND
nr:MAG TPA: HRAS-like suppressor 2 [Caudoviricetes sp.]